MACTTDQSLILSFAGFSATQLLETHLRRFRAVSASG